MNPQPPSPLVGHTEGGVPPLDPSSRGTSGYKGVLPLAGYWDQVAREWSVGRPHRLWRMHSDAVNRALLTRWLPAGGVGRLLKTDLFDEACGEGGFFTLLAERARTAIGIDVSAVAARSAGDRCAGLRAAGADVRRLPFADQAFDAVVSNSTLDHFESTREIVQSIGELGRVLRPGGELLLTLDNRANPVIALRNALPLRLLKGLRILPYSVGATFGPRGLRRALGQAGLEIVEMTAIMHCPRVLAVAVAGVLERRTPAAQQRFLRGLMRFERLARWPSRFVTGHFVAVRAVKTGRVRCPGF